VEETNCRGKPDRQKRRGKPIKDVYPCSLSRYFRDILAGDPGGFIE
jgi:hypothetical protein